MNRIISALLLVLAVSLLAVTTGCSTVEGLGKDIQKGGEAIEKTARKY
ncbi:entericidin A/B family lipoprotein [Thiolapillus sp.]